MPVPALKTLADKAGKSLADAEKYWDQAKDQASKENQSDNYAYIMGIVKKRLGLNESLLDTRIYLIKQKDKFKDRYGDYNRILDYMDRHNGNYQSDNLYVPGGHDPKSHVRTINQIMKNLQISNPPVIEAINQDNAEDLIHAGNPLLTAHDDALEGMDDMLSMFPELDSRPRKLYDAIAEAHISAIDEDNRLFIHNPLGQIKKEPPKFDPNFAKSVMRNRETKIKTFHDTVKAVNDELTKIKGTFNADVFRTTFNGQVKRVVDTFTTTLDNAIKLTKIMQSLQLESTEVDQDIIDSHVEAMTESLDWDKREKFRLFDKNTANYYMGQLKGVPNTYLYIVVAPNNIPVIAINIHTPNAEVVLDLWPSGYLKVGDTKKIDRSVFKDISGEYHSATEIKNVLRDVFNRLNKHYTSSKMESVVTEDIASTIAQQIGNHAFVMIGARNLIKGHSSKGDYLQFDIMGNPEHISRIIVTYLAGMDEYQMDFYTGRGMTLKLKKSLPGLYFDDLRDAIKHNTKLNVSL